ncbi:hypothetical protein [Paraburkholderia tropica]|uniref:hypothetical protein n=1 Tax=Paraburkholderia tropica TaxID=92647 RepID=UPI003D283CB6
MSFENFMADMGNRPSAKHSIERDDVNGDYDPGNCRWATDEEQRNNKRDSRFLEFRGERLTFAQWESRLGYGNGTIRRRVEAGWDVERTITLCPIVGRNQTSKQ